MRTYIVILEDSTVKVEAVSVTILDGALALWDRDKIIAAFAPGVWIAITEADTVNTVGIMESFE